MRALPRTVIAKQWLPFLGRRLGLGKKLSVLSVDPDDFALHHVFPTSTSLAKLLGFPGNFDPRAGGVGIVLGEAVNRAMGELLERYASLAYGEAGRVVCSRKELVDRGCRAVALRELALFTDEQLSTPGFPYVRLTDDTPVGWFEGTNLADGSGIFVPGELVALGYVPGAGETGPCFYPTSSGCALATSLEGALLSGILELIERDAVMIHWYARMAPPLLNFRREDLFGERFGLERHALDIRFHDMTLDGEVPVVGVSCVERTGRPCHFLLSAACRLNVLDAARKALIEVGQGRPFVKMLANTHPAPKETDVFKDFDSNLRFYAEPSNAGFTEWFLRNTSLSSRRFTDVGDMSDQAGLLRMLLDRCRAMSVTPIAFDITTPEMRDGGLFACKVFAPELVPLCVPSAPFLGHPRLAHYMTAARLADCGVGVPEWLPHPFP
jgi:ribosomal protein S12 methylthiotransferase accessory factor